jgi:hypothetical protein
MPASGEKVGRLFGVAMRGEELALVVGRMAVGAVGQLRIVIEGRAIGDR